jgi:DNA-binding FrmR family transcriptional regulator
VTAPAAEGREAQQEDAAQRRRIRPVRGYASGKDDYLRRLRKIEGQVRGLQKMIEADTWCPDVVTQVASATRALQEVAVGLLNDHLRHCVTGAAAADPGEADARFAEVAATIRQVIRLLQPWPARHRGPRRRRAPSCQVKTLTSAPAGSGTGTRPGMTGRSASPSGCCSPMAGPGPVPRRPATCWKSLSAPA